jgi:hypothetical protein
MDEGPWLRTKTHPRGRSILTWLMTARSTADFRHVDNSMALAVARPVLDSDAPEKDPRGMIAPPSVAQVDPSSWPDLAVLR